MTTEYTRTVADDALIEAIRRRNGIDVIIILSQQSQSININYFSGNYYETPLLLATQNRVKHGIVSTLLNHGADPNIPHSKNGWTPLHYACQYGNFHTIELLLKFNANVNYQNIKGMTPLYELLYSYMIYTVNVNYNKKLRCIQLLLDNHANVNIQDVNGISCAFFIIELCRRDQKNLDISRLLLNYSNDVDINLQIVRTFDIYVKGDTTLHAAVRISNTEIVQMILECCTPDLLIRNSNHETAYDIVLRLHHKPIMKCLKMTLQLQCHIFLRQKWIKMKCQPIQKI